MKKRILFNHSKLLPNEIFSAKQKKKQKKKKKKGKKKRKKKKNF